MADFRKYVLAAASVACALGVSGVANAQSFSGMTCFASASTPFDMRAEGVTEQAGDVVISCNGGTPTPSGSAVPQVNITVTGNANITSRLINSSSTVTEALLLVDDSAAASQSLCSTPLTGCSLTGTGNGGGTGTTVGAVTTPSPVGSGLNPYSPGALPSGTGRFNAYSGVLVGANIITFFGVPVDPPGTGSTLSFRITNVRLNVSSLGAPAAGSFSTIPAYETISSSAGFTINNPVQTVGNVRRGLIFGGLTAGTSFGTSTTFTTTSGSPSTLQQCSGGSFSSTATSVASVETINFSEGFATATKLRVPTGGVALLSQPGNFYNTESQFVPGGFNFGSVIGLADFATRIKITFSNVQSGVSVFVPTSINNVGTVITESLQLVSSETASEPTFPAVSATSATNLPGNFTQISLTSGSGVAVYEVTSQATSSPSTIESFAVPVLVSYTASPSTNTPALGTSSINVDFAPSTGSVLTATSGPIPRFVPSSTAANGFTINACSTVLLFPFMSNLAGFDTGFAIASTSTDPFGTAAQTGTCTLNFYGSGAGAATTTPVIASGKVYTNLVSNIQAGFQGYMIAQCNFQFAHGYAFISDGFGGPGRGLSEGYLAIVLPDPHATGGRLPNPPGAQTVAGSGESGSH